MVMQNVGYSLNAKPHSGAGDEVHGVLMLRDGTMLGGDSHVYYTGSYECSQGTWQRKSRQQTQTGRPLEARVVHHCVFRGTYKNNGAKVDAMAIVGEQVIRYNTTLRFLAAARIHVARSA
jgi:hypothetical protein